MSYSEALFDFQAAIKDLREVAVDLETATKLSSIADRLTEARLAIQREQAESLKKDLEKSFSNLDLRHFQIERLRAIIQSTLASSL